MKFRPLFTDIRSLLAASLLLLVCGNLHAQNVILHLRNGDRIAGTIISESTNEVTLSTVWIKQLTVPLAQIERREITPTPLADAPNAAATNAPAKSEHQKSVLAMKAMPKPADTNTWWKRWKGDIAIGTDIEHGATDHQLNYGRATLTYSQPYKSDPKEFFHNIFTYDAEYGKTDGTVSDNRMGGSSKTDFDLSRQFYVYNLGAAGYDRIRLIDLHYEDGPGMGYHWFNATNFALNLELGANYQADDYSNNTRVRNAYYRFGQNLTFKINKQLSLTEKYEYFPQADSPDQFRMRFESSLNYALILNFSLNLSLVDLYDTQPAATVPNNDFQLRTSLGVKF
jgi:hypothetical protein